MGDFYIPKTKFRKSKYRFYTTSILYIPFDVLILLNKSEIHITTVDMDRMHQNRL